MIVPTKTAFELRVTVEPATCQKTFIEIAPPIRRIYVEAA